MWDPIEFPNGDGSYTILELRPTTNLATSLKDDKNWPGEIDVIKNWPWNQVPKGTESKSQVSVNCNWRIDLQGVHPNGPDGRQISGVNWANLQIQLGGLGKKSQDAARNRRSRGLSTTVAEIHVPVGVRFPLFAFQRAFAESQNKVRDGGAQVWMFWKSAITVDSR